MTVRAFAQRIALALCTGAVFIVVSELMFWGRYDFAHKLLRDTLPLWLVYSCLAYLFLWLVRTFRVRRWPALFLAGGVYGWLGEGVIVQTMYDDFPLNLSWTGLAWHSLLTVCGGWYVLRRSLRDGRPGPVARASAVGGVLWGLWSVWWWVEERAVTPLPDYALYATICGLLLIAGLWGSSLLPATCFPPSRGEKVVMLSLLAGYYAFGTVRAAPISLLVLPVCLGLAFAALDRNRRRETEEDVLVALAGRTPAAAYLGLLLLPAVAIAVYALLLWLGLRLPTGAVFCVVTALAGFVLFAWSVVKLLRRAAEQESVPAPLSRDEGIP